MRPVCVCAPARDEAERLPVLLDALAGQSLAQPLRVVLCVNNSRDGSALTALAWAAASTAGLELEVIERDFEPALAHVGSARRVAMDRGAELLGAEDGVLISTDADCRPPPTWVGAILAAMDNNPDRIIGGRIVPDPREVADPVLLTARTRLDRYWAKVRDIEDAVDPAPWDPPPRHGDHTGASLALTVGLYRRAGGVPLLSSGEDVALVDAARMAGGWLAHPETVWTYVSARTRGRAPAGMAVDMRRLAEDARAGRPPRVPDFSHWRARATWRKAMRGHHSLQEVIRTERELAPMPCDMELGGEADEA